MIADDSVIAVNGNFCTVDRLNSKQLIYGKNGLTFLERVEYNRGQGILVETKYNSIIVTPNQKFLTDNGIVTASELTTEDWLLTSDDTYHQLLNKVTLDDVFDMFKLVTKDSTFNANGFVLLT